MHVAYVHRRPKTILASDGRMGGCGAITVTSLGIYANQQNVVRKQG